jgi:hypothetical protein
MPIAALTDWAIISSVPGPARPDLRGLLAWWRRKWEDMNTEKFESHNEGWRTLLLAIAGVMGITLIWNVLMLTLNGISY